jgi:hypothetical protein
MPAPVYRNPPTDPARTVIRRAPARMAFEALLGVLLFAVAAIPVVVLPSWLTWIASILMAVVALGMFIVAFTLPGAADCPGCGKRLFGLDVGGDNIGHQCDRCLLFVCSDGGELVPTPERWSGLIPVFGVLVGASPGAPPELCCVCAAPATRKLPLQKDKGPYLDMPHCAEHEDGARLGKHGKRDLVLVRSLAFARAWAEEHGHALVGNNRHDAEQVTRIPWLHGLGAVGMLAFGIGVHALLTRVEQSGGPVAGHSGLAVIYNLVGKKVLAGAFIILGASAIQGFVMRIAAVMRKRWGLA